MKGKHYILLAIAVCLLIVLLNCAVPQMAVSALIFLETGRMPSESQPVSPMEPETSVPTAPTLPASKESPVFTAADLTWLSMRYGCDYRPNLESLLTKPLRWDLTGDGPTVLIVHTHATEGYVGTVDYRSQNAAENILAIGAEVARILKNGGISVIHDTTLHDHPDYNSSYANARKTISAYLAQYPTIRLVLDLHRDADDRTQGQMVTSATVGGQRSAQLMMVVGTDARGNYHPNWQENLALALKLTAALEQENPGICRPVNLRQERFNMDLTDGSLLVEVGAAGNTQQEALIAANALAQAILSLAHGANLPTS